jgi:hypothetical protein
MIGEGLIAILTFFKGARRDWRQPHHIKISLYQSSDKHIVRADAYRRDCAGDSLNFL